MALKQSVGQAESDGARTQRDEGRPSPHRRLLSPDNALLGWLAVAFGALLRLRQYGHRRSLWMDEASISWNIVHRTFGGLLGPLEYAQGAPIGWLWLQKGVVTLLGSSEYALRLVPLLCGVASLIVFRRVASMLLPRRVVPVAVVLLAISPFTIYYANEAKQYSSDLLVGLVITALTLPMLQGQVTVRAALRWGVVGALLVWFSHAAVLVLVGFGACVALVQLMRRRWQGVLLVVSAGALITASVGVNYVVSLRALRGNDQLLDFWQSHGAFPPRDAQALAAGRWVIDAWALFVREPLGLRFPAVLAALALLGLVALLIRDTPVALVVLAPFPIFVTAALLHAYPFSGRLVLILAPFVLLLLCAAIAVKPSTGRGWLVVISVVGLVIINVAPAQQALSALGDPTEVSELRPVLEYVARHRIAGDEIWVEAYAQNQFNFYGPRLNISMTGTFELFYADQGCDQSVSMASVLEHGRTWVVFGSVTHEPEDRSRALGIFSLYASSQASAERTGAGAFLFQPPPVPSLLSAREGERFCFTTHDLRTGPATDGS